METDHPLMCEAACSFPEEWVGWGPGPGEASKAIDDVSS